MIRISLLIGAALLSAASWAGMDLYGETNPEYDGKLSDIRDITLPPAFNANTDPEAALRDYPLGVIPKQAAFSRHGPPHKRVTLANGKEGWVYEIPHQRQHKRYTLEFDDGVVIDVIYKDNGLSTGITATEMQAHKAQPMAPGPIP